MKQLIIQILLTTALVCLTGCTDRPRQATDTGEQPTIYPDYTGVTIPVGIAPLNFAMADDSVTAVHVEVTGSRQGRIQAHGSYADFDIDDWHQLLADNKGGHLEFSVSAKRGGQWFRYRPFRVYVSTQPLDDWGITYRRVAPGYGMYSLMGIYQRELSSFEELEVLANTRVGGDCVNCHTANRANPDQYTYHVRGKNGATVIHRQDRDLRLPVRNDTLGGPMVYPYWHPGGRYCAYSTNATSQMFHMGSNKRIEVYDSSSDVFVYDCETQTVLRDTLIMQDDWAENCPAFSPEGQWLYFVTARRQDYPTDYDQERYSLCRVSFDAENGRLGTRVDTLVNARLTGKSASWPRPSYDGRYLMYTQADYGYFTIWHPEADLWLLDLETGQSRPLDAVNSQQAESLHNWSRNSKWFLFTSRRDDGLYSRLYFASISPDGKATKPFMLPQRNPRKYYRELLDSYNTPDFTIRKVDVER